MNDKQIEGQMSIWDFIPRKEPIFPVDVKGLCDDAYCPKCGYSFDEHKEVDCERCPVCHIRVDWERWHNMNDDDWWLEWRERKEGSK